MPTVPPTPPPERPLTDDDRMPFGKHVGTRLGDVPDGYLRWLWWQGRYHESVGPLRDYICNRLPEAV